MSLEPPKLCCIHCGKAVDELFHMFCGTLRLRECENCGCFIDELLEVEPMIIAVKLFLQRKEVFRHFCRNELGVLPLQVPVVVLAMDMFLTWNLNNYGEELDLAVEEVRWNVVRVIIQTCLGWSAYVLTVYFAICFLSKNIFTMSRVFYIIIVASFCKLFNIGIVLWSQPEWLEIMAYVVEASWLLAQYRMLQCSLDGRRFVSAITVACGEYLRFSVGGSVGISSLVKVLGWTTLE